MAIDERFERIHHRAVARCRVEHQEIRVLRGEHRVQLRRVGCRTQGVGIPEHRPEMSEEMAREEGDDVQEDREKDCEAGRVWRMSQNAGFLSQNAGLRDASRPYVRGSRSNSPPAYPGVAHVPPPAHPARRRARLVRRHRLRHGFHGPAA